MSRYPMRPGLLVEFRAGPDTPREPSHDSRPASYLQEAHIRAADALRRSGHWSPSWLAIAFELPGGTGIEELRSVFAAWTDRHEALRSRFRLIDGKLRRFTFGRGDLTISPRVVGRFTSGRAVGEYLEAAFDRATDPLAGRPPYLCAAVLREDVTTVVTAFDHSLTDGYSTLQIPYEIHEFHAAARTGRRPGLAPVGSHVDYSAAERLAAAAVDADHPAVGVWRRFLDAGGGTLPVFPLDRGVRPGRLPSAAVRLETVLDTAGADLFEAACEKADGRFHHGLMAACAIAAFETAGVREFRTTVPMHTRFEPQWVSSLGWYVNMLPVRIKVSGGDSFADVFSRAAESMRAMRPALGVPSGRACELAGASSAPRFIVSYMDMRAVPGREHWAEWNVRALGRSVRGDHLVVWFHHRADDGVSVTAVHPDTPLAGINVGAFLDRVRQVMNMVAVTGDYGLRRPGPRDPALVVPHG
ncbi:condensation domain-containing protein [Streptomyces tailanensis]|uniref:condensation domain-containing protein n=1 Tax=Streptomyces tailanensis TaxID=2569858 RepID=UPI001C0EAC23|nr:condensation domain-containing protein [Streptomyces tailanensis]